MSGRKVNKHFLKTYLSMKNNVFALLFLLLSFLCGCDPMDDRMVFYNNSSENISFRMVFIAEDVTGTWVGLRNIESHSKRIIGILGSWESEFEHSGDSILNVVVFNDYDEASNISKSDSLLKVGSYKIHRYSYRDLEINNWQIKYPDDGFEKGRPLNFIKENTIRKPSPRLLKEKEIGDRWNK